MLTERNLHSFTYWINDAGRKVEARVLNKVTQGGIFSVTL